MNKPITLTKAKVTTVGNSAGVALPKEVLARLRVGKGDMLYFIDMPEGVLVTPYDPAFVEMMEAAETVMREDRDVLKALAK
jgi:putative addiction module antidote